MAIHSSGYVPRRSAGMLPGSGSDNQMDVIARVIKMVDIDYRQKTN